MDQAPQAIAEGRPERNKEEGTKMTEIKTAELIPKMMEILTPLSPEERRRLIGASLTLLGDEGSSPRAPEPRHKADEAGGNLPGRAQAWMGQNNVSLDELEQVFQIEQGKVEVIAPEVPGKNEKKTYAAYVLTGVSKLLASGEPSFDDKSARAVCKSAGCFNTPNHAAYIADKGNEFTGTKEKGWTLIGPGLKRGAALVKELNGHGAK